MPSLSGMSRAFVREMVGSARRSVGEFAGKITGKGTIDIGANVDNFIKAEMIDRMPTAKGADLTAAIDRARASKSALSGTIDDFESAVRQEHANIVRDRIKTTPSRKDFKNYDDFAEAKYNNRIDSLNVEEIDNINALSGSGAFDVQNKLAKKMGVAPEDITENAVRQYYGNQKNRLSTNGTINDRLEYYQVPKIVAGGGATAFLVSKMAGKKGELSNAELYGQQSPYSNNNGGGGMTGM
jgi:hypothetical protein